MPRNPINHLRSFFLFDVMREASPSAREWYTRGVVVDIRSPKGDAMSTYCGVDFHARQQTVTYCESGDGEVRQCLLLHQDKAEMRKFYAGLKPPVIVGFETSAYGQWFEDLLEALGCEVWIGDAKEIRRKAKSRHKNDRKDSSLIFELMVEGKFPRIFRSSLESREILQLLRYRQKLIKIRTITINSLHTLSIASGLSVKRTILTKKGRSRVEALEMRALPEAQRQEWFLLADELLVRISRIEKELEVRAEGNDLVKRVQTLPGIGLLTSLALVHTLGPIGRFSNSRQVVAYVGLDPLENSSAERVRFGKISKAGSRILRYLLGQAAFTAARLDPDLRRTYNNLSRRRGSQKAITAVARKLLIRAYVLLRDGIDYEEFQRRAVAARPARNEH